MLKKLMITTALSGLMMGAAAAQSTPPADTMTAPSATPAAPATTGDAKFINSQAADQWLSSSFIGMDVIGPDEAKIGDIVDILFDKSGNVVGYVVGVGGFLGIGQKNVALAPTSFQPVMGTTGSGTTGSASGTSSDEGKLKLNMTKDQLQQAAAFESKRDQESKARSASQPGSGGGMNRTAPK